MRLVIAIFLLLVPGLLCVKPSMKNALRNQVVIDFKNAIVPIISKQVEHMVLPDIHTDNSGFHIDVTNIHIDVVPFHPNQIGIIFVPNTSILRFSANSFSMKGSAHIHAKWKIISKSMDADIGVTNLGIDCQFTLLSNNGKPNIRVDSLAIHLAAGNVSIHIHGDIINQILNFLVNLLKGHIVSLVVSLLQSKLPPIATTEINNRLNTLPSDISIWQNFSMKYSFPYAPYVKQDYLYTGINVYVHPKGNPNPPPYEPPDMPEFDASNPKGIQFFFSDYVVKSGLDASFAVGLLTMDMEKDILGHHIKMSCKATKAPSFAFVKAVDVVMDAECVVTFDSDPKNKFTVIAQLHVNLKEYIKAAVLFFTIVEVKFNKLEYINDNKVDIEWFKNGINDVLAVAIQIVNGQLGQRGFPLPTIAQVDYSDLVEAVGAGYILIGCNPIFHF